MGLLGQLFKKDSEPACAAMTVCAPAEGKTIALSEFPDPVFSQGIMGKGCGILPSGRVLYSPFNGTVTQVADTLHAVGVTSDDGVEVLMHIGIDTVAMNGKGFQASVREGQRVRKGDTLIAFDSKAIKAAGYLDAIAVVVTNSDDYTEIDLLQSGDTKVGEPLLQAKK